MFYKYRWVASNVVYFFFYTQKNLNRSIHIGFCVAQYEMYNKLKIVIQFLLSRNDDNFILHIKSKDLVPITYSMAMYQIPPHRCRF